MAWQVIWSEKSVRQLKKLDKKNAIIIRDKVLDARNAPYDFVTRLAGSQFFRLRVGKYRVVLDLQQNKLIVFVITVDLRKRVYKK